jgi:hypothetical protein
MYVNVNNRDHKTNINTNTNKMFPIEKNNNKAQNNRKAED